MTARRNHVRRPPGRPAGGSLEVGRDDVLAAAERVIARSGPGASIDAIAEEVGVSKPIVYARVGGRGELADALAERLADRLQAAVAARVRIEQLDRSTLAAMFHAVFDALLEEREVFVYVTQRSGEDPVDRTLALAARSSGPLAALVADARVRHGADPEVAEPWAYAIVGMLNMSAQWWMQHGGPSAAVLADQLAGLVWDGLTGPRQP